MYRSLTVRSSFQDFLKADTQDVGSMAARGLELLARTLHGNHLRFVKDRRRRLRARLNINRKKSSHISYLHGGIQYGG